MLHDLNTVYYFYAQITNKALKTVCHAAFSGKNMSLKYITFSELEFRFYHKMPPLSVMKVAKGFIGKFHTKKRYQLKQTTMC
jgi:hypothetical protein